MKLELKHLTPYLPYGLKYRLYGNFPIREGVDNYIEDIREISPFNGTLKKVLAWKTCKPILHPLSDLTKEIEVNGEKFVPIYKLADCDYYDRSLRDCIANYQHLKNKLFWDGKLFEWHFDVFGLIKEGLAIDINTL